jgi:hypothetical protein
VLPCVCWSPRSCSLSHLALSTYSVKVQPLCFGSFSPTSLPQPPPPRSLLAHRPRPPSRCPCTYAAPPYLPSPAPPTRLNPPPDTLMLLHTCHSPGLRVARDCGHIGYRRRAHRVSGPGQGATPSPTLTIHAPVRALVLSLCSLPPPVFRSPSRPAQPAPRSLPHLSHLHHNPAV